MKKKEYSSPKCIELGNMVKITKHTTGGSKCDANLGSTTPGTGRSVCN